MEAKEVLQEFYERMRNPLFGSFVLAWLVWNWRIPMAVIVLDKHEIRDMGFDNVIKYIPDQLHWCRSLVAPFLSAVAYVLFNPTISKRIKRIQYSASEKYNKWEFEKASEKGKHVPSEWYIKLADRYRKQVNVVNQTIEHLQEEQQQIDDFKLEITTLKESKSTYLIDLNKEKNIKSTTFIEGRWNIVFDKKTNQPHRIKISGYTVRRYAGSNLLEATDRITIFEHYKDNGIVNFVILRSDNLTEFFELRYDHGSDMLKGKCFFDKNVFDVSFNRYIEDYPESNE